MKYNILSTICVILCVLFLGCLLKMPYGYFQLVRFVGMIGFVILAINEKEKLQSKAWLVIWISSTLLINPFLKISLGRTIWNIVDVIWVIFLSLYIVKLKSNRNIL
ncbi:DUF6804 family protein [Flavobacterium notoginsengisoli]|uniref:DUF6804 family protein n=1 Tax=Flavobacterium notoginsengisoli TaxID=1478199 RepID=UPI00362EA798